MSETGDCEWFRQAALDYVGGELSRGELAVFRSHYAACGTCSEILRTIEGQAELLTALPRPEPPRDLGSRIERAVSDRMRLERGSPAGLRWFAAAAAAILLAAGLTQLKPGSEPRMPLRTLRIVDVALPADGLEIGRFTPSYENPGGSALDLLVSGERK